MPGWTSSSGETASIDLLAKQFREILFRPLFESHLWKSAKIRIADTPATDLAGAIEKLRLVHAEIEINTDEIDLQILESVIMDLERLFETG